MNRERKKQILRDYPFLEIRIQNAIDQYNELYTTATHITASYGGEGGGTHDNESKIEKRCIKLAEVSARIERLKKRKQLIDEAVNNLKPYYKFLIVNVDIKGKGISRVANETHRDPSSLSKTHNKALDALKL